MQHFVFSALPLSKPITEGFKNTNQQKRRDLLGRGQNGGCSLQSADLGHEEMSIEGREWTTGMEHWRHP